MPEHSQAIAIPDYLAKIAKEELNENPAEREQYLQAIREWIRQQPHLTARTDDATILFFLRGTKFSIERTKHKIDEFYSFRTAIPEFFHNRDPMRPEIQNLLKKGYIIPLMEQGDENSVAPRTILVRNGVEPPDKDSINYITMNMSMIIDILLREDPRFFICGAVGIIDMGQLTGAHARNTHPPSIKKSVICLQDGYPVRLKAVNFVNTNKLISVVFHLVTSLLSEKIQGRVKDHGKKMDALTKHIGVDVLPKEYGGKNKNLQYHIDYWKTKVESYRDWFIEDGKYGCDESKRPGQPKNYSDLLGIEGSFRKLDVD